MVRRHTGRTCSRSQRDILLCCSPHHQTFRFEDVPGDMEECRFVNSESQPALSPTVLATLWGVDEAVLKAGVMRRTVTAGGTSATVALNAAQVGLVCSLVRMMGRYLAKDTYAPIHVNIILTTKDEHSPYTSLRRPNHGNQQYPQLLQTLNRPRTTSWRS